jgi:hypothetical protein
MFSRLIPGVQSTVLSKVDRALLRRFGCLVRLLDNIAYSEHLWNGHT